MQIGLTEVINGRFCQYCGKTADTEKKERFFLIKVSKKDRNIELFSNSQYFYCRDCLSTAMNFYKVFDSIDLTPYVSTMEAIKKLNELDSLGFCYNWRE
jgi:hypothetical protein